MMTEIGTSMTKIYRVRRGCLCSVKVLDVLQYCTYSMYSKRKTYFWLRFSTSLVGRNSLTFRIVWWELGCFWTSFQIVPRVYLCYPKYEYNGCGLAKIRLMVSTIEKNLFEQLFYVKAFKDHIFGEYVVYKIATDLEAYSWL